MVTQPIPTDVPIQEESQVTEQFRTDGALMASDESGSKGHGSNLSEPVKTQHVDSIENANVQSLSVDKEEEMPYPGDLGNFVAPPPDISRRARGRFRGRGKGSS